MNYNVIRLTTDCPNGIIVANYPTKDEAEEARELLNKMTPTNQLTFFRVEENKLINENN